LIRFSETKREAPVANKKGEHMGRKQPISEEMIDQTLADSFPASDPPAWTLGRERHPEKVRETDPEREKANQ
jgi:hypothetical protein